MKQVRIAIVGCGFVADLYMRTLPLHPQLRLVAAVDRDPERSKRFCEYHRVRPYESFERLLRESDAEIVLNLTTPESHFEVSRACLISGKHVYSEKPLALSVAQAQELVELARRQGLLLSGAPSRLLSGPAQTMWKALREQRVGQVRLVYSEMDDGLVHRMAYKKWITETGAPWPYQNEFRTGTTLEHAGYSLTWLAAFFGPALSVTAFSSCLIPDKTPAVEPEQMAPDFSVGCIQYASGVVARVTNSLVAPKDHSIRVFGDSGVLAVDDCWKPLAHISIQPRVRLPGRSVLLPFKRRLKLLGAQSAARGARRLKDKVDFLLGVVEQAQALREGREPRLSAAFCLHITETALALQNASEQSGTVRLQTSFEPIEPMPWAR